MGKPKSLPWFKYRVAELGQDFDAMPPAHEGVCMKLARRIWLRGPQTAAELQPWAHGLWDQISGHFVPVGDGLSMPWLEEAREEAGGISAQRSVAGQASAAKRNTRKRKSNGRSTAVDGSQTDVLSISPSLSSSPSQSLSSLGRGEGETFDAEIEPTFSQWWTLYDKSRDKASCQAKWKTIPHDTHVAIMEHTRAYLVAQPDKLYRKDPIRYLTKQSWTDEIVTKHQPTQQDKQAELDRIAFERYGPPQNG